MKSSIQHDNVPQSNYSTFNAMSQDAVHNKVSFGEFVTLMWALEADLMKKERIFMGSSSVEQKLAARSRMSKFSHDKQLSVQTVDFQVNQRILDNYENFDHSSADAKKFLKNDDYVAAGSR